MKSILIINGPNLQLIGKREVPIYGSLSFDAYLELLKTQYPQLDISYYQTNSEEELIGLIHQNTAKTDGIILNAGGLSHHSVILVDALRSVSVPVIEVHISQIFNREDYRKTSLITAAAKGSISGFGLESYRLALEYFIKN
jgi:3-dehydroquinate dehydratase-2